MARRAGKRQHRLLRPEEGTLPPFGQGGRLRPLSDADLDLIVAHALDILSQIGMSGLPDMAARRARERGGVHRRDGRLCFPAEMVRAALERAPANVDLPGFGTLLEMH